jgi:hypothetical protein
MDAANGLQIIPAPDTSSSTSSMQTIADLELVTLVSPSINHYSLHIPTLIAEHDLPFSWIHSVGLDLISRSLSPSHQLIEWKKPSKMQLDAVFYPSHQPFVDTTRGSHSTVLPLYVIASLVNNVSSVGHTTSNDAYALLKALPLDIVSRSFRALPTPVLDAFKERVFATAVRAGDVDLVSTMLELNINPRQRIMMEWPHGSKPAYPLEFAIAAGHFLVAKILLSSICQGATQSQIDESLSSIAKGNQLSWGSGSPVSLRESETTELMCIALIAGACPNRKFMVMVTRGTLRNRITIASLVQLVNKTKSGMIAWLEAGLLELYSVDRSVLAGDLLQLVLHDCQYHLPIGDPKLKTILLSALRVFITYQHKRAVETILKAFSRFGCRLDSEVARVGDTGTPGYTDSSILHALGNADWHLAASLMVKRSYISSRERLSHGRSFKNNDVELRDAIKKKNLTLAYLLLEQCQFKGFNAEKVVELAISLGQHDMTITIIKGMEDSRELGFHGLAVLLEHGQTTTVSALLSGHPIWDSAFKAASQHSDYGPLETIIFEGSSTPFFAFQNNYPSVLKQQQLCFRAIAFHAIATDNFKLCKWLFQLGMDADELCLTRYGGEYELNVEKFPVTYYTFRGSGGGSPVGGHDRHRLPSLLAIAAEKNNREWIRYILAEGVSPIDSMALLRAVNLKATIATIHLLLKPVRTEKRSAERTYGIAALRQAIRFRDFNIINVLCRIVDIDAIEPSTDEIRNSKVPVSPLGEAIILKDLETVGVLLQRGVLMSLYEIHVTHTLTSYICTRC